ncbi:hypothetical protein ACFLTA_04210 [Bacteroidota bacterium]
MLFVSPGTSYENPVTRFTASDSVTIEFTAYYDSQGLLENYGSRVYTPVCEGDKCYAIEIDFYWDFIGRFLHYDTIPGKGLTKLDHIPFTTADYLQLKTILNSQNSLLASYNKEELVRDTRSSDIDGFTGATINEIKESVIEGAVYSCYTLWHIANGPVRDNLGKTTKSLFSKELIVKLVDQEDQEINYFLINNFSEEDFKSYLPEVLEMISDGQGYFAKNAIEKIPDGILSDSMAQRFFASNFNLMDYFAQVALLESLSANFLSESMKTTLSENIDARNSYKNQLIKSLLSSEKEK